MRTARTIKKVRLNLDMAPSVKKKMESLRDRLSADSLSEVVRRAIIAYEIELDNFERLRRRPRKSPAVKRG